MRFRLWPERPLGYHRWYAWYPVYTSHGFWVWREYVHRNLSNARRFRYSPIDEDDE